MGSHLTKAIWDMKSHSSVRIMIKLDKPDRRPVTDGEGGRVKFTSLSAEPESADRFHT